MYLHLFCAHCRSHNYVLRLLFRSVVRVFLFRSLYCECNERKKQQQRRFFSSYVQNFIANITWIEWTRNKHTIVARVISVCFFSFLFEFNKLLWWVRERGTPEGGYFCTSIYYFHLLAPIYVFTAKCIVLMYAFFLYLLSFVTHKSSKWHNLCLSSMLPMNRLSPLHSSPDIVLLHTKIVSLHTKWTSFLLFSALNSACLSTICTFFCSFKIAFVMSNG